MPPSAHTDDNTSLSTALPPTTTAGLAERNLRPVVRLEEAREYDAYVGQFDQLSLSQDLSEKDRLLYASKIELARSAGLGRDGQISEKEKAFYEAVANFT